MTRDEKIAQAYGLRFVGGWHLQSIATELDVRYSTIWKWLNPERNAEINRLNNVRRAPLKRAWENNMRATCSTCGGPMRSGSLKVDGSTRVIKGGRCAECLTQHRVQKVLEMWRLRNDLGLLNTEIAERLGVSQQVVATELTRLRALGYEVRCSPYRGWDKRPTKASALSRNSRSLGRALEGGGIYPTRTVV